MATRLRVFLHRATGPRFCMRLHRQTGGTPPNTHLPGRIPDVLKEVRCEIRRGVCLGLSIRRRLQIHTGAIARAKTEAPTPRYRSAAIFHLPIFSATRFSAIPFFVFFRFFRLSPKRITCWSFRLAEKRKRRRKKRHHSILVSLRSPFSRGDDGDGCIPDAIPSPKPWDNRSHLSRPYLSAIHFSAIALSPFFVSFGYHRNSLCARPAWRGLSALIFTRWAHFTWGVAPGWYRSGLWPLLSVSSDQSANGVL